MLYQLNAAIQGAAGLGIIRGDRGIGTVAIGLEAVGCHGILRREDLHHGSGPAVRQVEISGDSAHIIRLGLGYEPADKLELGLDVVSAALEAAPR